MSLSWSGFPMTAGRCCLVLMALQGSVQPANLYILAKTGDTVAGKMLGQAFSCPAINSHGLVAFAATYPGGTGIFTPYAQLVALGSSYSGSTLQSIGPAFPLSPTLGLSADGTVAFLGNLASGASGIFTATGTIAKTGDSVSGKMLSLIQYAPVVNNNGVIAYFANFPGGGGAFTQSGAVAKTGDTIAGKVLGGYVFSKPVINSSGAVAFNASSSAALTGIFRIDPNRNASLVVKAGDMIGNQTLQLVNDPALADNNDIAFHGLFNTAPASALIRQNAILVRQGDVIGGKTIVGFDDQIAINNSLTVFHGYISGGAGIFSTSGPIALPGDVIGGKTLSLLQCPVINNAGQIAFGAGFTDNTEGIVVNSPSPVTAPFGVIDTPANNATGLAGGVGFTGWAIANPGIVNVALWREPVAGETPSANGLVYLSNVALVPGARPDLAAAFPGYPDNDTGWGGVLLTNELPNSSGGGLGTGTYRIHALATSASGQTVDIATRVISTNNTTSQLPFGTIDTPANGATVSGSAYVNFGWAVTPNPANVIPKDGSTITVFIDNVPAGHPVYNNFRSDISTLFPGLQNSAGAVGYFVIDTTKLINGLHTIAWSVTDNAGNGQGIGSRFFNVQN